MDRAELLRLDRAHLWHPYTPFDDWRDDADALVIDRAAGVWLEERDGRRLLDGNASWWSSPLGHAHPRLLRALGEQAARMPHVAFAGITHEPAVALATALLARAPAGLSRVFYTDDGSTAVEAAIKLAVQCAAQRGEPRRRRFVALQGAFHGDTLGATGLGGVEVFRRPFADLVLDCVHVPPAADGFERAFEALAELFRREGAEVAALVLEPVVQGAAGMRIHDPAYLRLARELCDRHGALLVFDEVFTGYGRTGPFWAGEHAGVSPDLLCTAKGFTGGVLPMGATLATEAVFEAFRGPREHAFWYGHTFAAHPLGAAVAREVLAIYDEEQVLERARPGARLIAERFAALAALPGVVGVRALGHVGAVELAAMRPKAGSPGSGASSAGYLDRAGWRVYREALARGVYLRPLGNVVYVTPALTIGAADLALLLDTVEDALRAVLTA